MGLTRRQGEGLRRISLVLLMIGVLFLIGFSIAMGLSGGKDLALGLGVSSLGALLLTGVSYGVGKYDEYRESDEEESAGNDRPIVSNDFSGVQSHLVDAANQVAEVMEETTVLQLRLDEEEREHQGVARQFTAESRRLAEHDRRLSEHDRRHDESDRSYDEREKKLDKIEATQREIKAQQRHDVGWEQRCGERRKFYRVMSWTPGFGSLHKYIDEMPDNISCSDDFFNAFWSDLSEFEQKRISAKDELNDTEKLLIEQYKTLKERLGQFKNDLMIVGKPLPDTQEALLIQWAEKENEGISWKKKFEDLSLPALLVKDQKADTADASAADVADLLTNEEDDVGITNGIN